MDHESTREQLELAAVEPHGLERLRAGDTATAQAVAAHLAGCPSCTDELGRLERASALIRTVVREQPPADLRDRVLGAVRAAGVPRGAPAAAPAFAGAPEGGAQIQVVEEATRPEPTRLRTRPGRGPQAIGWVAAIAAAIVLSVVSTSLIVGSRVDEGITGQGQTIEALEQVAIATLHVTAEPDARRVRLAGTSSALTGDLIYSPRTSELVVVATGLTQPPAGQEYRCWVEQGGVRQRVGKMFFSDALAYWVGPAPAVSGVVDSATFGVSLAEVNGSAVDADPVLGGSL